MAFALRFFTCLVVTVCIVASVDAAISCDTVGSSLAPCGPYLRNVGVVTALCCERVKKLNRMATTTTLRQQTCRCLQSNSKRIPGFNPSAAFALPKKCGVSIPYPISMSTNCNNVK